MCIEYLFVAMLIGGIGILLWNWRLDVGNKTEAEKVAREKEEERQRYLQKARPYKTGALKSVKSDRVVGSSDSQLRNNDELMAQITALSVVDDTPTSHSHSHGSSTHHYDSHSSSHSSNWSDSGSSGAD